MVSHPRNADVVEALDLAKADSVNHYIHEDLTVKLIVNYKCSYQAKKIAQRLNLIYWNAELNETELTTMINADLLELIKRKHSKLPTGR